MKSISAFEPATRGDHLILYDGVCGLCNRVCQFVLARDARGTFDFASLQSATGRAFLLGFGKDPDDLDTFGLVTNYRTTPALHIKSAAALGVTSALPLPWRWLGVLRVVPRPLRDWAYDVVARHRYEIFGRFDRCQIPTADEKQRFIDI